MSEAEEKTGFKKRAHRPWETSLLEQTVQEAITLDDESIDFELDLNSVDETEDISFPEFNFLETDKPNTVERQFSHSDALNFTEKFGLDGANRELKNAISQTQYQQELLMQQFNQKSNNTILLGGFFQPQQLTTAETSSGRKMQSILTDLKDREQKLSVLTTDLKISEAIERAKQSELSRKAEEQNRFAAENRMRDAVQQAHIAADQFRTAMDQVNKAVAAQQEEEQLRIAAEIQAKEARIRANEAEIAMQNERLARLEAEEKSQQALVKAEQAILIQRQLQETIEQNAKLELAKKTEENRRLDLQQQYDELQSVLAKVENEHNRCASNIRGLEVNLKDLDANNKDLEQKLAELTAQREKLKTIITTEQELRKLSERKMLEAQARTEKSEQARLAAEQACKDIEQQLKIVDERAKRAIAHASRTVMHLLNAPPDNEYTMQVPDNMPKEKLKIKVPADASGEYVFSDEDYKF